ALYGSEGARKNRRPTFGEAPASGRGWAVGGPHGCVAVGAVIPCAHRGGAALRDVWGGRCSGVRAWTLAPELGRNARPQLILRHIRPVAAHGVALQVHRAQVI